MEVGDTAQLRVNISGDETGGLSYVLVVAKKRIVLRGNLSVQKRESYSAQKSAASHGLPKDSNKKNIQTGLTEFTHTDTSLSALINLDNANIVEPEKR